MKWCVFCRFPANFRKNWRFCGFYWTFKSKKYFSFRGAFSPWPPDQGLCLWTPLGAPPPYPRYRLALCALAMAPRLPNPKYATTTTTTITVQVLSESLLELFNSLTFIMLAGNPLHCNCELRWLRRWLANDSEAFGKVLDSGDMLCVSPSTITGPHQALAFSTSLSQTLLVLADRTGDRVCGTMCRPSVC